MGTEGVASTPGHGASVFLPGPGWEGLFEEDHIQLCLSSAHTKSPISTSLQWNEAGTHAKSKKEKRDDIIYFLAIEKQLLLCRWLDFLKAVYSPGVE